MKFFIKGSKFELRLAKNKIIHVKRTIRSGKSLVPEYVIKLNPDG
jgi:hypothetical protein